MDSFMAIYLNILKLGILSSGMIKAKSVFNGSALLTKSISIKKFLGMKCMYFLLAQWVFQWCIDDWYCVIHGQVGYIRYESGSRGWRLVTGTGFQHWCIYRTFHVKKKSATVEQCAEWTLIQGMQ